MVILLRAAELNLDNHSCNMIFAHPVEWTVLTVLEQWLSLPGCYSKTQIGSQ